MARNTQLRPIRGGDETIMAIAGHVSRDMLKHYAHIRTQAKRAALEAIVRKPAPALNQGIVSEPVFLQQ